MTPSTVSPWSLRIGGFLVAEAISAIGSWATMLAIWGFAAYEFDASAGEMTIFGLAFSVPGVFIGPVAGTVIDRVGPKATLAIAKVIGIGAALALLNADDFRALAVLSALNGVANAFSFPALQALPARLVDDSHLARTNALVSLTDELAIVLGPVLAAVAIGACGFRAAFVIDAATFALGLVVLPLVRQRPLAESVGADEAGTGDEGGEGEPSQLRAALEGWRLVRRTAILRRLVIGTFSVHLLYGLAVLSEPLYVRDVLERGTGVFAALQTTFGIFLVAGGLISARVGERLASYSFVAAGVSLSGITAVLYLGTPFVAVAFAGVGLWGLATALLGGPARTVLQRSTPVRVHGRVSAADFVAGSTAEFVGVAGGGLLVSLVGVQWTVLGAGGLITVAGLVLGLRQARDDARPR